MANAKNNNRALIEERAALIVIDIQASTFIDDRLVRSIGLQGTYAKGACRN